MMIPETEIAAPRAGVPSKFGFGTKTLLAAMALALLAPSLRAAAPDPALYLRAVRPFFEEHCFDCHDGSKQKGGLNLETLKPGFATREDCANWTRIFDRMERGEMPPPEKPRPPAAARGAAMQWIGLSVYDADVRRHAAQGRTAWKRLNRVEYQNTIRDLLYVSVDVEGILPEDGLADGFDNVDLALDLSAVHLEKYLEAADVALDAIFAKPLRTESKTRHFTFLEEKGDFAKAIGTDIIALPDAAVFVNEYLPARILNQFHATVPGLYRFRLSASAYRSDATLPLVIYMGTHLSNFGKTALTQVFDAPPGKPRVIEWTEHLDVRETLRIVPFGVFKPPKAPLDSYTGPGLAVQWVEIDGPLEPAGASAASRLFGGMDLGKGTAADADRILHSFIPRAFRRSVVELEVRPFSDLFKAKVKAGLKFEDALRVCLKAVLVSPDFLYFEANPGRLDDFALASRLSYFLWSSMPDEALLAMAGRRQLASPSALHAQVERMLLDPKAAAFTENFTGLWLRLREIRATTPDKKLYPEFDELLEWSMVRETHAFFNEILTSNLSILNFVQSDFAMLNARLAEVYGIPGVDGFGIRKVALKPEWHRGGVLTQASILKVTANGTNTSPVPRGVFFLDRILGRPVPPPPKNTPAIEPDTRGATTIRAQLEKHRNVDLCATCHNRIDPPGAALESFDVIGAWRENYRALGLPQGQHPLDPHNPKTRVQWGPGPPVQCDATLPDGRRFANIDEFKTLLLADPAGRDQIVRCLAEKILIYATGHELDFADRAAISEIIAHTREKNYGLRDSRA